jgi:hypothetical protein
LPPPWPTRSPENRFQSIDIRKPLLLALPLAKASIIDELPKGFRLPEGQLHSVQEPLLPRKVIREALANAAMHRNYTLHSPTQIIRYNRTRPCGRVTFVTYPRPKTCSCWISCSSDCGQNGFATSAAVE